MGKFYEKDIGIYLDIVNIVAKQVLLQGLDVLAYAAQQSIPLVKNLTDNFPSAISHSELHVAYHPGSIISLLSIISQLSLQLIKEREEQKIEHKSLDKTIYNQIQGLIDKDAEIE